VSILIYKIKLFATPHAYRDGGEGGGEGGEGGEAQSHLGPCTLEVIKLSYIYLYTHKLLYYYTTILIYLYTHTYIHIKYYTTILI
jgi:hypothetical protein